MSNPFADIKVLHALPWNSEAITTVAFIGNDKVAAGNRRGDILLWNLSVPGGKTPDPARKLAGHSSDINRIIVTPDGKTLISASNDRTIKYWDAASDQGEPGKVVLNDGFSPKGVTEKVEKFPDPPPPIEAKVIIQKPIRDLTSHAEWVQGLTQTADGRVLVTGDDNGLIIVWDLPSAKELRRWQAKYCVRSIGISPDGKTVALSEAIGLLRPEKALSRPAKAFQLWDAETGKPRTDLTAELKHGMAAIKYSGDGKWLAVCVGSDGSGVDGTVILLDPATGKKIREMQPFHKGGALDVGFHPDGKHLFSSGRDAFIRIWQLEDGKLVRDIGDPKKPAGWINAISISPDGRLLAAATQMTREVVIYSLTNGQQPSEPKAG